SSAVSMHPANAPWRVARSEFSNMAVQTGGPWVCTLGLLQLRVRRPLHGPEVHACQVLAEDAEREQLDPRKDRNERSQEWESRNALTLLADSAPMALCKANLVIRDAWLRMKLCVSFSGVP